MKIYEACITLALARREAVSLDDARGIRITARTGLLWVTQERGRFDHLVGPGSHFTVTRAGRTVIEALEAGCAQLTSEAWEKAAALPLTRARAVGTIGALAHALRDRVGFGGSAGLRQGGTR